jgi:hypothetical protein
MNYSRSTARRRAFGCATLAIALAGCGGLPERPPDDLVIYYEMGDAWTTTKRRVRLYACRNSAMVCTGPASYLDVEYQCRCE